MWNDFERERVDMDITMLLVVKHVLVSICVLIKFCVYFSIIPNYITALIKDTHYMNYIYITYASKVT